MGTSDTTSDRIALARQLRELESNLERNKDLASKPWIAHPDHVRGFFQAYEGYLSTALTFPELPQRQELGARQASPLPYHRDNLGSLAGRIVELAAALELSTVDFRRELEAAHAEIARLHASVQHLSEENEQLKKAQGKPRVIGEGMA